MLTMSKDESGYFTHQHAGLALAVATQAATAIENARLFEHAEARTRELSTLLDVSRNVASTLALKPLLSMILEQVNDVARFDRSALMLLDGDDLIIEAVLNTNDPNDPEKPMVTSG